jgi:hypothetical protein
LLLRGWVGTVKFLKHNASTLFITKINWFTAYIMFLLTMLMKSHLGVSFNQQLIDYSIFVYKYDIVGLYFIYGR